MPSRSPRREGLAVVVPRAGGARRRFCFCVVVVVLLLLLLIVGGSKNGPVRKMGAPASHTGGAAWRAPPLLHNPSGASLSWPAKWCQPELAAAALEQGFRSPKTHWINQARHVLSVKRFIEGTVPLRWPSPRPPWRMA